MDYLVILLVVAGIGVLDLNDNDTGSKGASVRYALVTYSIVLIASVIFFSSAVRTDVFVVLEPNLNLPITEIRKTHPPYAAFCRRNPGHCEMVGPPIVELVEELRLILSEVNAAVNTSINYTMSDKSLYDQEEYWTYPSEGFGDCEDIALEKRARLVKRGVPRAAMTMAIVQHKSALMSHAVLLVETTSGTYILNGFTNNIILWNEAPYNYEMRERLDGTWERYDQSLWTFE